jgi:hypothetical protein
MPQVGINIKYKNERGFEEGDGIGSDYFKFRLRKSLK